MRASRSGGVDAQRSSDWKFTVYIAGHSPLSDAAVACLEQICRSLLNGGYEIEVVDLTEHPELARRHQILAVPTVIRNQPLPERRVIGDLSLVDMVVNGLGLPESA